MCSRFQIPRLWQAKELSLMGLVGIAWTWRRPTLPPQSYVVSAKEPRCHMSTLMSVQAPLRPPYGPTPPSHSSTKAATRPTARHPPSAPHQSTRSLSPTSIAQTSHSFAHTHTSTPHNYFCRAFFTRSCNVKPLTRASWPTR